MMKTISFKMIHPAFKTLSRQFWPGVVSAIIAFPLSIGLAVIAGVQPQVMIVASIYAYFISAMASASRYSVGGPNTAVAMVTGAAVAPYATTESDLYLGYVLALCLMVGVVQFIAAFILRRIDVMDYIPATVIDGLTLGIGAVFILSSLHLAMGLAPDFANQWIVFNAYVSLVNAWVGDGNYYAMIVSGFALLTGALCWRWRKLTKYAIVVAVVSGTLMSGLLTSLYETRLENVGFLKLNLLGTSLPDFREVSWTTLASLLSSAVAIAVVGILQTLSIAKGLRHPGEPYKPAQEIACQGTQNMFMAFFGGAPVSNSFNKSAIMFQLHGGRAASVVAGSVTAAVVLWAPSVIAILPMAALGAALILVGASMMQPKRYAVHFRHGRWRATLLIVTAVSVVVLSVQEAIVVGAIGAALYHFAHLIQPAVRITRQRSDLTVTLHGPLFYASAAKLNRRMEAHLDQAITQRLRVSVNLSSAHLLTGDAIESDWLHRLVKAGCTVRLICTPLQVDAINTWTRMNVLPHGIHVVIDRGPPGTPQPETRKPRLAA